MSSYAVYPSLRDRIVIITGGATGIGASLAEHFALQGSKVAFLDVAEEAARKLVDSVAGRCAFLPIFIPCDLTDIAQLRAAMEEVRKRLGDADVLVNNAANDDRHNWQDVSPEYWDGRIAANLKHQFFAVQSVAPGMQKKGMGSIINMSSISWMIPSKKLPLYVMSKAAILGMTRAFSGELGEFNIRVNCLTPGAILTDRQKRLWLTPEYETEVLSAQMLKRHLLPVDVARMALFLAADDSDGITGKEFVIDGGWI